MQMNWIKSVQCSSSLSALKAIIDVIIQFTCSYKAVKTANTLFKEKE